jgi:hypothetical protein
MKIPLHLSLHLLNLCVVFLVELSQKFQNLGHPSLTPAPPVVSFRRLRGVFVSFLYLHCKMKIGIVCVLRMDCVKSSSFSFYLHTRLSFLCVLSLGGMEISPFYCAKKDKN